MARFFTTEFKRNVRVAAAVVTVFAGAAPFIGGLIVLQFLGDEPHGLVPALIALASFSLGGLLPWFAQNRMGLAGNGMLRRRLWHSLASEGHELGKTFFVGFAPGERLHVWQGETDRDVGFLTIAPEVLAFRGDEFSWTLPRKTVDHIDLTPVEGGLQRICIRWHIPREAGRAFSLESREASSISQARLATHVLYRQLREWLRREPQNTEQVQSEEDTTEITLPALGFPPTDMAGAQVIEEPASGSCLSIVALGVIVVTAIWRVSGAFFAMGHYYEGILWAGLISVLGALVTGYFLHYLQAWEAEHGLQGHPKQ